MSRQTHLYRHLDAEGRLLYVGISLSALDRLSQHKRNAHWFTSIASVTIETFSSRKEAVDAEELAIKAENPAWNIRKPRSATPYCEPLRAVRWPSGRRLTERRVLTADAGRHYDGAGLHLVVSETGRKKWVLRYQINGVRRDKGLGSYPTVNLKDARERASEAQQAAKD